MPVKTPPKGAALVPPTTAADPFIRTAVSTTPLFANVTDELLRMVAAAGAE